MKCVIRPSIWESNSSMSHSCIILPKRLAKEWEENDDMYHYYGEILTFDELKKRLLKDKQYISEAINNIDDEDIREAKWEDLIRELKWEDICTYEDWNRDYYGDYSDEIDSTEYTTEHGDEIVIFCKYGAHY